MLAKIQHRRMQLAPQAVMRQTMANRERDGLDNRNNHPPEYMTSTERVYIVFFRARLRNCGPRKVSSKQMCSYVSITTPFDNKGK